MADYQENKALPRRVEVPRLQMYNGLEIPALALGTYLGFDQNGVMRPQNKELRDVIHHAIKIGYRHIDTASFYQTEEEIGEAIADKIADGTIKREDFFITTKLWNTDHDKVEKSLNESLKKLGVEYIDLYLMHWPIALHENYTFANIDYMETWRTMEALQKSGLVKSIGLSNFNREQLSRVINEGRVRPAALQIEVHPMLTQTELVSFAQEQGLVVMAYSPFGSLVSRYGMEIGGPGINDPKLVKIANKYGKSTPQVVLRWLVERKVIPIPKTTKQERLWENLNIFDFSLTADEVQSIATFNVNKRFTLPSFWQQHPHYPFEKIDNPIDDPFKK